MMHGFIIHFELWNVWRKKSLNGKFYKILVLFKMVNSPSFEFEKMIDYIKY